MRGILRILVLVIVFDQAFSCGKGHCRRGRKCANNKPTDKPKDCSNEVECALGRNAKTAPFADVPDSPVQSCDSLNCNFQADCCWHNAQPPVDQMNWVKASGAPDANKMQQAFGTTNAPEGDYLITASDTVGSQSQTAEIYSCPISCTGGDIRVRVKHWTTKGTKIQVCTTGDPGSPPQNCKDLPEQSGNQDEVTVPGGQNQRIAIQAVGFTVPEGTVAMISNIEVQCDPCVSTQAPPPPVISTPAPPPSTICQDVPCDFEDGTLCKYQPSGTAASNFGNSKNPFNNRLTGVPKAGQGKYFAASYMKAKAGEKTSMTTNTNFDKDYVIKYKYHEDTDGIVVKGCCNDDNNCPHQTSDRIQAKDYQAWQQAAFSCPTGTNKVVFVADNTKGANEGAAGIDDIQVFEPAQPPDSASTPTCSGSSSAGGQNPGNGGQNPGNGGQPPGQNPSRSKKTKRV